MNCTVFVSALYHHQHAFLLPHPSLPVTVIQAPSPVAGRSGNRRSMWVGSISFPRVFCISENSLVLSFPRILPASDVRLPCETAVLCHGMQCGPCEGENDSSCNAFQVPADGGEEKKGVLNGFVSALLPSPLSTNYFRPLFYSR